MLFGLGAVKPRSRASASRSIENAVPARAAAPERHHVDAGEAVAEPLAVAREHEHVGEQMVGEQDGLRALQVRVAGHGVLGVLLGAPDERGLDGADARVDVPDDVAQIEPLVERDLIVAGAARMELASHRPRQLDEPALDVHVDVFELPSEREAAALDLGADGGQSLDDRGELGLADQRRAPERARPGRAAFEVIRPEAAVEGQRRGERFRGGIRPLGEAPGPGLARGLSAGRGHEAPARPGAAVKGSRSAARRAAISPMIRRVTSSRSARVTRRCRGQPKCMAAPNRTDSGCARGT